VEEEVMLPGVAPQIEPTDPAVVRVLTDHVEIRRRTGELEDGSGAGADQLNALGEMLNAHVRHEERVLFPMIEEALSEDELGRLAQRIEEAERSG
jgi:hemerythrin-like domain-containing protein